MPTRWGAQIAARIMTIALLVMAIATVAVLLFRSDSPYTLRLTLVNASQLVEGNLVKVGGVPVGKVRSIELSREGQAEIELSIDDPTLEPLHSGTRAEVRSTSLAGIANRYVSLTPGPSNHAEIPSGGDIPAHDASAEVDLDQLLNTLDTSTVGDLKQFVRGSAGALSGREREFGRALEALNPALSQIDQLEREILRDQGRFARFLVESATVVTAVASRDEDLSSAIASGRATLDELAQRDAELDRLLRTLPPTLRTTNTTLVNLRATLDELDPTIVMARPVAAPLADFLDRLRPVARDARPVVARLRRTVDRRGDRDLLGVLAGFEPLARVAVPAFESAVATVEDALPIVREARPYTPDLIGGLANGFGGTTGGYYDANGHYTRISFQSSAYTFTNLGSLAPIPPGAPGLTGYRKGLVARCPGAATQSHPDGSNPWVVPGCEEGHSP